MSDEQATAADTDRFKKAVGHFCTGVAAVAATVDGAPVGFSVQSFVSLSLDPPLVIVCPAKASSTWPKVRKAGVFAATILADNQGELCRLFATSGADKFAETPWRPSPATGSPIIDGGLAWADCSIEAEHEGGDHTIVVARVLDLGVAEEGDPLLFYRGAFGRFTA